MQQAGVNTSSVDAILGEDGPAALEDEDEDEDEDEEMEEPRSEEGEE